MARLRLIRRLLRELGRLDNHRRKLLAEAVLCLIAARIALIFISFPRLARSFGAFVSPTDPRAVAAGPGTVSNRDQLTQNVAQGIGWAVTRAARYLPVRAVCLPQAMAARVMLKRRNIASIMHFGAAKGSEKPFDIHAWLDAAGVEVTGYPVAAQFAEVGCFV